jgi:uncharacterized membrane protein
VGGLRLAGHPVHPIFTDFPIALLSTAVAWDVVGLVTGAPLWWAMAFWTLVLGVSALLPTAATGFWDFLALSKDSPAAPTAVRHMVAVLAAGALFVASLVVRGGASPPEGGLLALAPGLGGAGLVALVVGGRLGGALVFRYGIGRADADTPGR